MSTISIPIKLISCTLLQFLFYSCHSKSTPPMSTNSTTPPAPNNNNLQVVTNPAIELLSVVQYLSDDKFNITKSTNVYVKNVQKCFGKYANHPAVIWYKENRKNVFPSFDGAQVYFIQFELQNDKLVLTKPQPEEIYHQYSFSKPADFFTKKDFTSMPSKLDKFKKLLEDFCHDTKFMDFYNSQSTTYQLMIKQCNPLVNIDSLQQYFGCNPISYQVILAPLFTNITYLPYENNFNYICIAGPMENNEEKNVVFDNTEIQSAILFDVNNTICSNIIDSIYNPKQLTKEQDENRNLLYKIREANYFYLCNIKFKIPVVNIKPIDVATARINYFHIQQQYVANRNQYPIFKDFIDKNYLKIIETANDKE